MNSALSRLRKEVGLTQVEVGHRAGRSQSWVTKLEQAELGTLGIGTLCRYLAALGVQGRLLVELGGGRARLIPLPEPGGVGGEAGVGQDRPRLGGDAGAVPGR